MTDRIRNPACIFVAHRGERIELNISDAPIGDI